MTAAVERERLYDVTVTASYLGLPAVGVLGVVVPYLLGMTNLSILGLYLAAPMILAPLVVRSLPADLDVGWRAIERLDWRVPSILIHATLGLLIYLTAAVSVRPRSFFVGYAAAFVLLFVLILSETGEYRGVISIYHLCVTLLVSIYSVTLKYNYFIGETDVPPHEAMMLSIYRTGTMPESWQVYESFVLWHVYSGYTYSLLDDWIVPRTSMFLLSGLLFAAGVPMLYALARRLMTSERVALLSCLILIATPEYVFYGMYAIPRSVTSVLFVALLLTLLSDASPRMRFLRVLLIGGIVVYHTVTIPFLVVLLLILYGAERVFSGQPYVVDDFSFVFLWLLTAVYWLYRAEFYTVTFFRTGIGMIEGILYGGTLNEAPDGVMHSPWQEVANYVPYSFLLLFVLFGFLIWFDRERYRTGTVSSVVVATVVMIPLLYPGPGMLLDALAEVQLMRFAHYGFVFVALTAGYGVYALVNRGGAAVILVLVVLLACFSFVAVSNDFVASDNPTVERQFYTFYITEQEEEAFDRVAAVHQGSLGADHITCRYVKELRGLDCSRLAIEDGSVSHSDFDGVVIREGELAKRSLLLDDGRYADAEDVPRRELADRNRVLDSGTIVYYR